MRKFRDFQVRKKCEKRMRNFSENLVVYLPFVIINLFICSIENSSCLTEWEYFRLHCRWPWKNGRLNCEGGASHNFYCPKWVRLLSTYASGGKKGPSWWKACPSFEIMTIDQNSTRLPLQYIFPGANRQYGVPFLATSRCLVLPNRDDYKYVPIFH